MIETKPQVNQLFYKNKIVNHYFIFYHNLQISRIISEDKS